MSSAEDESKPQAPVAPVAAPVVPPPAAVAPPPPAAKPAPAPAHAAPGAKLTPAFTGGEAEFSEMPALIEGAPDAGNGAMQGLLWGLLVVCGLFVAFWLWGIFGVIRAYYF